MYSDSTFTCMPTSSELFYNRRSRLNRTAASASTIGDLGMGFEYPDDRSPHFPNYHRRYQSHRHDLDGCDPLRRSPHLRHHHHRFFHSVSLNDFELLLSVLPHLRLKRSLLLHPKVGWGPNQNHFSWVSFFRWKFWVYWSVLRRQA